ncbi:uncharacterized protein BO66DRAFT_126685 [Aspergillus aculeatinus CBS 121060]|uniref:Uncharacterized protein n=1 Tax=Aspergillus aculeatinus CBS 121060 TaxID=1448322 RepID=A0ACD1H4M2_9EURO|nr:hypothetical protein BO66DRAFT_126685 [Aspergillus aculeatinus CBS 121060]RAH68557.1 hypothetical protein BO66DRAFT_126685 [Aspergillus aculeatinus CBS 121060]
MRELEARRSCQLKDTSSTRLCILPLSSLSIIPICIYYLVHFILAEGSLLQVKAILMSVLGITFLACYTVEGQWMRDNPAALISTQGRMSEEATPAIRRGSFSASRSYCRRVERLLHQRRTRCEWEIDRID